MSSVFLTTYEYDTSDSFSIRQKFAKQWGKDILGQVAHAQG